MFMAGIFIGEKFPRQCSGRYFEEEVSLNRSNHSATVQVFQLSQNRFNFLSTNYSTQYKSLKVVQIIQRIINRVQIIKRN